MWEPMKSYQFDRREHQPYCDTRSGVIIDVTTPTDMDYLRRKAIAAQHNQPNHPVFNPEDYT